MKIFERLIITLLIALTLVPTLGATQRPDKPAIQRARPVAVQTYIEIVPVEPTPTPTPISVDSHEATLIAKTLYGEARGCSKTEQSAVVWCILNRVGVDGFAPTVEGVITQPYQFAGYSPNNPVTPELYELAVDVLTRWEREKMGEPDAGRTLPREFLWFSGDGKANYFRDAYIYGQTWEWGLPSPYGDGM